MDKKIKAVCFAIDYMEGFKLLCSEGTKGVKSKSGGWSFETIEKYKIYFSEEQIFEHNEFFNIEFYHVKKSITVKIDYMDNINEDYETDPDEDHLCAILTNYFRTRYDFKIKEIKK